MYVRGNKVVGALGTDYLSLTSEVWGAVLWDGALNLWDLTLFSGREH